jgi:hypothetical protein
LRLWKARNRLEKQTDKARAAVETAEAAWRKAGG